jgi:ADP-heptose:LPS heptosyltransferase
MLALAAAAGFPSADADDRRPALTDPGPAPDDLPFAPYVVVHPGTDAPARAYPAARWHEVIALLVARGHHVVVTGSPSEVDLARSVGDGLTGTGRVTDRSGRTSVREMAAVLRRAQVLLCANTGPAHLAAAVHTPVVSLFAPVVPAVRWAPWGVPTVVLGDEHSACRNSRWRDCAIPGHPCLTGVEPAAVVAAAEELAPALRPEEVHA